jgi:signal transduction histidine kinase
MTSVRITKARWAWRRGALVLAVVLVPVTALSLFASSHDLLGGTARFGAMIVSPAALVSAIACYAAWQINPRPGLAWMSFAVALYGCQGLMLACVQLIKFPVPVEGPWVLAADLTVAVVILLAVPLGRRARFRPDPAATGFAVGAFVAVLRLVWLQAVPDLGEQLPELLVSGFSILVFLVAAACLLKSGSTPLWARQRMGLAILLIGGAHVALYLGEGDVAATAGIAGNTLGALLLVSTSLSLFFVEIDVDERNRSYLNDELERTQSSVRAYRAQFHEINSTVAGIISASRLLRSAGSINTQRRSLLEDMIFAELGRLERLLARPTDTSGPQSVDLDETIGTLVVSHQARGHQVRWSPSGLAVSAQPDAVAEVINILLDNAAKHGRTATEVTVIRVGDAVEVAVRDDGPGVEESLRRRLFDWGARGTRSTGQGIGLHIAHELMQRQGGYLEIRDGRAGGATFVLGLPISRADKKESEDGDDDDPAAADLA